MVYGTAHTQTLGMVHHANGAVVPDDTLSVKAAKVDHLNAKATAYLNKPIVPLVQTVAAKPGVQAPLTYTGMYNYQLPVVAKTVVPTVAKTVVPTVAKTVLKAPVVYPALTEFYNRFDGRFDFTTGGEGFYGYNYPAVHTVAAKTVVPAVAKTVVQTPVVAKSVYSGLNSGLNYPAVYPAVHNTHLIKREAEAE